MVDLSVYGKLKGFDDYQRANEEFLLKKQLLQAQATRNMALSSADPKLPAALQLANEYQNRLDAGDIDGANLIAQFAKTTDRGLAINENGTYQPMPGYADAKAGIEGAVAGAKESGKTIAGATADATVSQPDVSAKAGQIQTQLNDLMSHPGKSAAVGVKGPSAFLNWGKPVPGTEAADFTARYDQIKGSAFLQAFETLKGGGQITEVEGNKATAAITRMNTAQSEKEFDTAVNELKGIVDGVVSRNQSKAKGNFAPVKQSTPSASPRKINWSDLPNAQ